MRFWERLDTWAHRLHWPWRGWICDRYDLSLGLTLKEIQRKAPIHEMHRDDR